MTHRSSVRERFRAKMEAITEGKGTREGESGANKDKQQRAKPTSGGLCVRLCANNPQRWSGWTCLWPSNIVSRSTTVQILPCPQFSFYFFFFSCFYFVLFCCGKLNQLRLCLVWFGLCVCLFGLSDYLWLHKKSEINGLSLYNDTDLSNTLR